jgi:hypothetical protein
LNDTINQLNLTDFYRVIHPATAQYRFFLAAHGTFSKIMFYIPKQVLTIKEILNSPLGNI